MPQFVSVASADARRSFEAERLRAAQLRVQTRLIVQHLRDAHGALAETMEASRQATAASRQLIEAVRSAQDPTKAEPHTPSQPASPFTPDHALATAGFGEADLNEAADALIIAYRTAVDLDVVEMHAPLRAALLLIGRHLAARVGPKAAGVRLN